MKYAVVIERTESNYSAYVPDLPGCVAVGDTLAEVEAYAASRRPREREHAVAYTATDADGRDPGPRSLDAPADDVREGRRQPSVSEPCLECVVDIHVRGLWRDAEHEAQKRS